MNESTHPEQGSSSVVECGGDLPGKIFFVNFANSCIILFSTVFKVGTNYIGND